MPDREKVIKGLEHCSKGPIGCQTNCPYQRDFGCRAQLTADVLAMLKEQKTKQVKQVELYGKDDWYGLVCVCPDCKAEWMGDESETHFCPNCGQAVKWNE